jgi:hypothetical protein
MEWKTQRQSTYARTPMSTSFPAINGGNPDVLRDPANGWPDTAASGFIAPSLLGEWQLSQAALAPIPCAVLFGLACGALLSGPVSDHWGGVSCSMALCFCLAKRADRQRGRLRPDE